jgi:putative transposase
MGRNYYSEIHLHFVWHTKLSLPLLTPPVEAAARRFLRQKTVNTPGAYVHEIGGTENHIHMAVTITPTIAIAEFIGQLKGSSSHDVNQELGRGSKLLEWQAGYGVVSFGTKDLEWVIAYIRNQREHHAKGTVHERLERIEPEAPEGPQREAP